MVVDGSRTEMLFHERFLTDSLADIEV